MFYQFHTEIAQEFGVEKAIIIHCMYMWIAKNAANNRNAHDGRYWTYNTTEAWQKLLPFMCLKTVKRHLASLDDLEIIVRANYNQDPKDRTTWYSFSDEGARMLSKKGYNISVLYESVKMGNAKEQSDPMQEDKMSLSTYYNNNNIQYNKENNNNKLLLLKKDENFCSESEPDIITESQASQSPPPTPSPNEDKEERLQRITDRFIEELKPYESEFGAQMLNEFFLYWSEPNKSRTKIRKDMQPTWDTHRRLLTWQRNNKKDIMRHGTYLERKAEAKRQSDLDTMQRLAEIEERHRQGHFEDDEDIGF
jgi:hypothetical protein